MNRLVYFFGTIAVTVAITFWASRRNVGRASYYAAEGRISATQNGLAIAGDFLSAGTVLAIVGLFFTFGLDAAPYLITPLAGFILMLAFIVGPLRRMGRFTLGDVVTHRLHDPQLRAIVGLCTIAISLINLVAQLVGAGALISIVFGIAFNPAVITVALLMTVYVSFGGMLAATWVQIIKVVLLICMIAILSGLCLQSLGGISGVYARAEAVGSPRLFGFGGLHLGLLGAISLALGQITGLMGMPHLLIRFFTVPDAAAARRSLVIATTLIGLAMGTVLLVISPAAVALVGSVPGLRDPSGGILGGPNMITMHLSRILGGEVLFGLLSAIAFSTILAVVAGITISIASASSHDLLPGIWPGRQLGEKTEIRAFKAATVVTSLLGLLLAILFQRENIAFLVVMAQTVAANTTFPLLITAIYWKGLSARGASAGGLFGLLSSILAIILGPSCWVKALGHASAIVPTDYPTIVIAPLTFAIIWIVSKRTNAPAALPHGLQVAGGSDGR